ncbi:MAG: hypothetical protein DCC71_09635 [Proteobacteria bacterium]|nr:MAG: hypothetical protein DCC71_09635 [Pseudomonadota bacterium]
MVAPLLALAWLASSAIAERARADEFCRCESASFRWRGCAESGSCDAAGWTSCTPTADDDYEIRAGCHVSVSARDDVLLAIPPPRRIAVRAGGSFAMQGPGELRVGPLGFAADAGSVVRLTGCFRSFADPAQCAPELSPDALFAAGRIVPCRDGSCDQGADVVRMQWSAAASPALLARVDAYLAGIRVARDVLCFWQERDDFPGADSGYCYKIRGVGLGPGARTLDFDVRQVWSTASDQAGYPLARRTVRELTLAQPVGPGARVLRFAETDLVVGRIDPVGRWIRCGQSQRAYLVAAASDFPDGDGVLLADARGVAQAYGGGARCHLDWGWSEGDRAFVMAPVHVTSHTRRVGEGVLRLEGDTTLRAVVVDGLGGSGREPAVQVRNGPLDFAHVWVVDPLAQDHAALQADDLPCGSRIRHLVVTGGPASPEHDKNYGMLWTGGPHCSYRVEHLYTRFMGDDNFVLESTGADPVGAIDLRWVQAGPGARPGDSGQLFDFGTPNPTAVSSADALCTACTSDDGRGSLIAPSAGPGEVSDLLWVGTRIGGIVASGDDANNPDFALRRFGVIGSNVDANNPVGWGSLTGLVSDSFYVRDVVDPRANPSRLCVGRPLDVGLGPQTRSLSRGVFLDVALGGLPCEVSRAQLSDLYFLDVARIGEAGPLLLVRPWASDVVLRTLTLAFRRSPVGLTSGVSAPYADAAPTLRIDGPLLTGLRGDAVESAMNLETPSNAAQAHWERPTCFFDNERDESPAVLPAYGVAPVVAAASPFVDPDALRFDVAPASPLRAVGCGAGRAGVPRANWAHRKAKLEPVYVGSASPLERRAELGAALAAVALLRALSRGSRAASPRGTGCRAGGRGGARTLRAPTARRD